MEKIKIGNDNYEIKYAYEILVSTAEWLIKERKLKESDCPIRVGRGKRYLINTGPEHAHRGFTSPRKLSNGLYIEANTSRTKAIDNARILLEQFVYQGDILVLEVENGKGNSERIKEEDFYKPFAGWLVDELEECTKAIALGGNKFKGKWGTPDVIGIREPRKSDIITVPTEVISAEIKADARDLITAFGQTCSYRLFSHKCHIVIPKNSSQDDISRLDSLCLIFGIGLVLFDNSNVENPQFEIRVRPTKHEPDMIYGNRYLKLIEKELF